MTRETTDYGIDLGTTTSAIAVATADDAAVVRNNLHAEYTPSAVHISKSGKVLVGAQAKERVERDPENACAEFKLQMGNLDHRKEFTASGRSMTPEELSAEVLKSLRRDVRAARDEDIDAAVITVPAAFELHQCDATRKAAALAGLDFAPLMQEPSAAAWAYSTQANTERGFWLVYDLGGGTFDAAIVKIADGEFSTINHAGDNFLGGKLIDWELVENLLIPAAKEQFGLPDLARGNARSAGTIAKLKIAAEQAKIQLSREDSVDIGIQLDLPDGEVEDFEFVMTRTHVEAVALPYYRRSITLCRKALADAGLSSGDVERVLLVGGATMAPALRQLLADPDEGLGIELDHSLDPVTVVARGAAIFAGTQRRPPRADRAERAASQGRVALNLEYSPSGSDTDPLVGGLPPTTAEPTVWTGATIEFVNSGGSPAWRSGQIPLTDKGTFTTRLHADEHTTSTYEIELRDARGTLLPTDPERIRYRHTALDGTAPTLSHSIGVALANNEVEWLVRKGAQLPAKGRALLYSTITVRRNETTGMIRVPIVEGELGKADRNVLIGELDITPKEVSRDVPAGSEVEVTLRIDTSFAPHADAYVPFLDEEFSIGVELGRSGGVVDLAGAADELTVRYTELAERVRKLGGDAGTAADLLDRFEGEDVLAEVRRLAAAAEVDPDAASTGESRLRDAQTALDAVEEALAVPELMVEGRAILDEVREIVAEYGRPTHRTALHNAERSLNSAIASGDRTVLERQIGVVAGIGRDVLRESGQWDALIFVRRDEQLRDHPDRQVQRLLQEGRSALTREDAGALRSVNLKLDKYVPADETASIGVLNSTVRAGGR
jgi:molecular chaperone DnaK